MRIVYPYNEILPTGRAHDVYLFNNCASLARHFDVTLLIGKGSPPDEELFAHYAGKEEGLHISRLPILRRKNFPRLNFNKMFHHACQRFIQVERPDVLITSVRKQGIYHVQRRVPGVHYVFEVHQLEWYPEADNRTQRFYEEREMLNHSDMVIVTTAALKEILQSPPYHVSSRIEVLPLATRACPLPEKQTGERLTAAYVGQLYPMQGVDLLVDAMRGLSHVELLLIGGSGHEVERLKSRAGPNVTFCGFQSPSKIPTLLKDVDVFLMPSRNLIAKPHVAHTKLIEYASFGKPIIAPDLPAVQQQLGSLAGIATYRPGSITSLNETIQTIELDRLKKEIAQVAGTFSWENRAEHYKKLITSL